MKITELLTKIHNQCVCLQNAIEGRDNVEEIVEEILHMKSLLTDYLESHREN